MLEFNMPVHEGWNIVHIAMQVPGAHQIYVCPENCARGVVMTAYEMGAEERFSCVTVSERDLLVDSLESVTIEGTADVLEELRLEDRLPRIVFLFTVCSHRFLSCDSDYVFTALKKRFPGTVFVHGFMDCIAQKEGPMPDEKLRSQMYTFVPSSHRKTPAANILGSEVTATYENNDCFRLLYDAGFTVRQLSDIDSYEGYMSLGSSWINICQYRAGDSGVKEFSKRLGIPYFFMLPAFDERILIRQLRGLSHSAGFSFDEVAYKKQAEMIRAEFAAFGDSVHDTVITIDHLAVNCPYGLAYFLSELGFDVGAVIADGPADYEREVCGHLKKKYPHIASVNPVDPRLREASYRKGLIPDGRKVLAIGPKAAWVSDTPYFVNQIENDGDYGLLGWKALLKKMRAALIVPKDLEKTVQQKGLR